jgi:hypothetical protein
MWLEPASPPAPLTALSPPPAHYKRRKADAIIHDVVLDSQSLSSPPITVVSLEEPLEWRPPIQYPLPLTPPRSPGSPPTGPLLVSYSPKSLSPASIPSAPVSPGSPLVPRQCHLCELRSRGISSVDPASGVECCCQCSSSRLTVPVPVQAPMTPLSPIPQGQTRSRSGSTATQDGRAETPRGRKGNHSSNGRSGNGSGFRPFDFFRRGSGS